MLIRLTLILSVAICTLTTTAQSICSIGRIDNQTVYKEIVISEGEYNSEQGMCVVYVKDEGYHISPVFLMSALYFAEIDYDLPDITTWQSYISGKSVRIERSIYNLLLSGLNIDVWILNQIEENDTVFFVYRPTIHTVALNGDVEYLYIFIDQYEAPDVNQWGIAVIDTEFIDEYRGIMNFPGVTTFSRELLTIAEG